MKLSDSLAKLPEGLIQELIHMKDEGLPGEPGILSATLVEDRGWFFLWRDMKIGMKPQEMMDKWLGKLMKAVAFSMEVASFQFVNRRYRVPMVFLKPLMICVQPSSEV